MMLTVSSTSYRRLKRQTVTETHNPANQETVLQDEAPGGASVIGRNLSERIRIADIGLVGHVMRKRYQPKHCDACGKKTKEGKDYCDEHVTAQPYAKELAGSIQTMARELKKVTAKGWKAVPKNSPNLQELKLELYDLPKGVNCDQVCELMDWGAEAAKAYVEVLLRKGLATLTKSSKAPVSAEFGHSRVRVILNTNIDTDSGH
jgi:hypothetical protein